MGGLNPAGLIAAATLVLAALIAHAGIAFFAYRPEWPDAFRPLAVLLVVLAALVMVRLGPPERASHRAVAVAGAIAVGVAFLTWSGTRWHQLGLVPSELGTEPRGHVVLFGDTVVDGFVGDEILRAPSIRGLITTHYVAVVVIVLAGWALLSAARHQARRQR